MSRGIGPGDEQKPPEGRQHTRYIFKKMTIQYFEDKDTLYIVLKNNNVAETRDLDENTLIEFDSKGSLVAMTIEHARERVELPDFSFERVATAGTTARVGDR